MHIDSIDIGQKVVLVDDILATGGSANAAIKLINQLGADILSIIFLIELVGLGGRQILEKNNSSIHSIIKF